MSVHRLHLSGDEHSVAEISGTLQAADCGPLEALSHLSITPPPTLADLRNQCGPTPSNAIESATNGGESESVPMEDVDDDSHSNSASSSSNHVEFSSSSAASSDSTDHFDASKYGLKSPNEGSAKKTKGEKKQAK